jgi:hypothetical protein
VNIAWGSLGVVVAVSLAVGVAVVVLVAFALVGLAARRPLPVDSTGVGRRSSLSPAVGTAVAALCLAAVAAIVGYGLYIIVA